MQTKLHRKVNNAQIKTGTAGTTSTMNTGQTYFYVKISLYILLESSITRSAMVTSIFEYIHHLLGHDRTKKMSDPQGDIHGPNGLSIFSIQI